MDNFVPALTTRRLTISIIAAISMLALVAAGVSARSETAVWSGVGQVLFIGPSQDPGAPTSSESWFRLNRDGSVRTVQINTTNEFVAGVLAGPNGSAITECRARRGSDACERLDTIITGSALMSIHTSSATLRRITEGVVQVPVPTPAGPIVLNVPTLSGSLSGRLKGQFALSNPTGIAAGEASLRITRGSTGTYACFAGQVPLESLQPCIENTGGQLFPILLDVKDRGVFEIGEGSGSMADILAMKGSVEVNAHANLLLQDFGGTVVIGKARASLAADEDEDDDDRGRGRGRGDRDD